MRPGKGLGAQGRTSEQRCLGRAQAALRRLRPWRAQFGCAGEERGLVQQGAAIVCHCRRSFQFGGDVLGGSESGCGQVPGSGLLVVECTRRGGQHSVRLPPGRL